MSAPSSGGASPGIGSQGVHAVPRHWLVSLGDSYISGEGARWAGNTSGRPRRVDALGPTAYGGRPGCDQARTSVAALGSGPLRGRNLACSGATTRSHWDGGVFKPGLDLYSDGRGHVGQLVALRRFAERHPVTDIVVSIGGNDFGFGSVLARCAEAYVLTVARSPSPCAADPALVARFDRPNVARVTSHIAAAFSRVGRVMRKAGSRPSDYSVVVETYPSPLPSGAGFRYREDLVHRLVVGGCPVFDVDAAWANRVMLTRIDGAVRRAVAVSGLPNVSVLDLRAAFDGHQLCERGVAQLQQTGLTSWRSRGARARLEWVNMVYIKRAPWRVQESLHPNYWGVLAERRCVRSAVRGFHARSGTCRDGRFHAAP